MKIQKFLHSCLLVEENGNPSAGSGPRRILIDPGNWSFGDGLCQISDVPRIDAILITHIHQDHYAPQIIKQFVARDGCAVYANSELANDMIAQRINATEIDIPQLKNIADMKVASVEAPHGRLPFPQVLNNGFLINERFFTPGDCHTFEPYIHFSPEILAMPIMAPWGTFTDAIEVTLRLKPKHVIPVHDKVIADYFAPRLIDGMGNFLAKAGIQFHPLKPGEVLEL